MLPLAWPGGQGLTNSDKKAFSQRGLFEPPRSSSSVGLGGKYVAVWSMKVVPAESPAPAASIHCPDSVLKTAASNGVLFCFSQRCNETARRGVGEPREEGEKFTILHLFISQPPLGFGQVNLI